LHHWSPTGDLPAILVRPVDAPTIRTRTRLPWRGAPGAGPLAGAV